MIGIGIDTGGTCTDAVVYDTEEHKVLSWSKAVTTHRNLKIGILEALKKLDPAETARARYVSLSTTLATNACVEDLGCRAKLILMGVNPKAITRMDGVYGLPSAGEIFFMGGDPGRIDPRERDPDWEDFRRRLPELAGYDCIAIVQINPNYNNGEYENIAAGIIREELGIPCVKGYDLYQEANVQRRGATALLNARLIPIMENFFHSIEESLKEMGLDLPILVVKSNGNVMTREYAAKRPVDTLLCGPAASVMGAVELLGGEAGVVCDIGGTTTDVAMVRNGTPVSSGQGIQIGKWRTMVKGISIDTFALGGDTAIEYHNGELFLTGRRAVPLCSLAAEFPCVRDKLAFIVRKGLSYGYPAQDFFVLSSEPEHPERYNERDRKMIRLLSEEPRGFEEMAKLMDQSPYTFKMGRLEEEGIVIRGSITPTDVMHYRGEFTQYDAAASRLGLRYLSTLLGRPMDEVCDMIYGLARKRLYTNLVQIMLGHEAGHGLDEEESAQLAKLTDMLFQRKDLHMTDRFLSFGIRSVLPLIGVGGPAEVIFGDVPERLAAEAKFPEHKEIANAIGATVGRLSCSFTVRIEPDNLRNWGHRFYLIGGDEVEGFDVYEDAKKRAAEIAEIRVREIIDKEGASQNVDIAIDYKEDFWSIGGGRPSVFVMTEVTARVESQMQFIDMLKPVESR